MEYSVTDDQRSFKIGNELFPNSVIAAIDVRSAVTAQIISDVEKKFANGKNENVIQCLVSFRNETMDEKLFDYMTSPKNGAGLDLVLIMGFGAFVKTSRPFPATIYRKIHLS